MYVNNIYIHIYSRNIFHLTLWIPICKQWTSIDQLPLSYESIGNQRSAITSNWPQNEKFEPKRDNAKPTQIYFVVKQNAQVLHSKRKFFARSKFGYKSKTNCWAQPFKPTLEFGPTVLHCKHGLQTLLIDYIEKHETKVNVVAVVIVFLSSQEVLLARFR